MPQIRHEMSVWRVTSVVFNVSVHSEAKWHLEGQPIPSLPLSFTLSSSLTLCHLVAHVSPCVYVCVQMCDSLLGCLASTHYHISFSPLPLYPIFFQIALVGWMNVSTMKEGDGHVSTKAILFFSPTVAR